MILVPELAGSYNRPKGPSVDNPLILLLSIWQTLMSADIVK